MLITQKQLLRMHEILLIISKAGLTLSDNGHLELSDLLSEIRNQQSNKLIEVKE